MQYGCILCWEHILGVAHMHKNVYTQSAPLESPLHNHAYHPSKENSFEDGLWEAPAKSYKTSQEPSGTQ